MGRAGGLAVAGTVEREPAEIELGEELVTGELFERRAGPAVEVNDGVPGGNPALEETNG